MSARVIAMIQARYGSSRLPGKVLLPLAGHSVLWQLHQRLARVSEIDECVVMTTARDGDRPVVDEVRSWGGEVFAYEGDVDDLLGRYLACGDRYNADIVVMVDGDCPLVHPPTISAMIHALLDHSSSEYARLDAGSIEGGVAVLRLGAYKKINAALTEWVPKQKRAAYREHATLCIMENPERFSIVEVPCFDELRGLKHRLWLDTEADYEFLKAVYDELYREGEIVDLLKVVGLLKVKPELRELNSHVRQKSATSADTGVYFEGNAPLVATLKAKLPEERGIPVRADPDAVSSADAVIAVTAGDEHFRLGASDGRARITVGDGTKESVADIVALTGQALGARKLATGYFEADDAIGKLVEVPCPLCAKTGARDLWEFPSGAKNAICEACGHVFLRLRPSDRQLAENYRIYGQSYAEDYLLSDNTAFAEIGRQRARFVESLVPERSSETFLLEVGSGDGHFLQYLAPQIGRVAIEPSGRQARFLRRHRPVAEVWQCGYDEFDVQPGGWPAAGFDVIVSFHVLEHVTDPIRFMRFVRDHLSETGAAVIAVPNLVNLGRDLIELHYLTQGFHLQTFHPDSLEALARGCGLRVEVIEDEGETAALSSSMRAVLRRDDSATPVKADAATRRQIETMARAFHTELEDRVEQLRRFFDTWRGCKGGIVVYGGGVHTESLFSAVPDARDEVVAVIDDDTAKHGTMIAGIPVKDRAALAEIKPGVVLVSSLSAEDRILARLEETTMPFEVTGIYRDLFKEHE